MLAISDLERSDIHRILGVAKLFESLISQSTPISQQPPHSLNTPISQQTLHTSPSTTHPHAQSTPSRLPALHGKNVVLLFVENSTRTQLSFAIAAQKLSANTVNLSLEQSSMGKGESLFDTVQNCAAMGANAIVVRHACGGTPLHMSKWVDDVSIINAGDGCHEHPTQALSDIYTAHHYLGTLQDKHIAYVGDIRHSRVAGSGVRAFVSMGAKVTLVAPAPLLPPDLSQWPVAYTHDFDAVLDDIDICYMTRTQSERNLNAPALPLQEFRSEYGLTQDRAKKLSEHTLIMHPGPMNKGVEIDGEVVKLPNAVIAKEAASGVPIRMAVLFLLLGSDIEIDRQVASANEFISVYTNDARG